jgi:hypothetical protein
VFLEKLRFLSLAYKGFAGILETVELGFLSWEEKKGASLTT